MDPLVSEGMGWTPEDPTVFWAGGPEIHRECVYLLRASVVQFHSDKLTI